MLTTSSDNLMEENSSKKGEFDKLMQDLDFIDQPLLPKKSKARVA